MKKNILQKWFVLLTLFGLMCISQHGLLRAQNITNYTFSTSTSGSLEDLTTGSTSLVTGNNDTYTTGIVPIGFNFSFMGGSYSHFSANSNGQFLFHTSGTGTAIGGGTATVPALNTPHLCLMSGDNEVNDGMRYKVIGTAPNRTFVLEWTQFYAYWTNITNAGNMQLWLHEATGVIEYVYGEIYNSSSSSTTRSIGLSSSNTATTAGYVTVSATPTFTAAASFTTNSFAANTGGATATPLIANLGSSAQGSRRVYTFTPTAPVAPSSLTFSGIGTTQMTLNWIDNTSTELGYRVYRSLDGVSYSLVTNLPPDATSYVATSLSMLTTYHWKVVAYAEVESPSLVGIETTTGPSLAGGVKTIGAGGDYENLTTAFADINAQGIMGDVDLQLITGYPASPETYPILSCNAGATGIHHVKVYPTVPGLSITSANPTGTLRLDGAKNLTFDGRVNQTGASNLIISNTNVGASYAIQFVNDASSNTLQYLTIHSSNNSTTSGTIVFAGSTGTTGNDNNLIDHCDIKDGATTPLNAIYSAGTSTAINNSGNIVSNSNIYNYFGAGSASNGIFLSSNSSEWTIDANMFYQTATRTSTSGNTHRGINIVTSNGNGYVITNNIVGFANSTATGTTTYAGSFANRFLAIEMTVSTSGTASSVQGNTVAGVSLTTTSGATTAPGIFSGISVLGGSVSIGDISPNMIGLSASPINVTTSTTASIYGIYASSSGTLVINNNEIGSISGTGSVASATCNIYGINSTGSGISTTISDNVIGGSTATALVTGTSAFTTASSTISGIETATVTTLTALNNTISHLKIQGASGTIYGIRGGTSQFTVKNNLIHDLTFSSNAGTSSSIIYGVYNLASPTIENIENNQIYNLSIVGANTSSSNIILGVYTFTTSSSVKNFSSNHIYNLSYANSSTGSATVSGISTSSGATVSVFKNKIYNLSSSGTGSSTNGILSSSGTNVQIYNNVIGDLKAPTASAVDPVRGISITSTTSASTYSVYYNSIYLNASSTGANFGAAGVYHTASGTATTAALDMRNNIIINESTQAGTGFVSALRRSSNSLSNYASTSNRNLLYAGTASANNAIMYDGTTAYQTMPTYQAAVAGRDLNSFTGEVTFTATGYGTAGNFFISTTPSAADYLKPVVGIASQVESGGEQITTPAITDDYEGTVRQGNAGYTGTGTSPDLGAFEFEGVVSIPAIVLNSVTPPATSQCVAAARVISAEITTGLGTVTSATIGYSINGVVQTPIAMTNTSGNTWEGTLPVPTPSNATIDWTIIAQNSIGLSTNYSGTSYQDEPLTGVSVTASANPNPICIGSSTDIRVDLSMVGTGSYSASSGTSSSAAISPFYHGYGGAKTQYIYRVSELISMGFSAGDISALALNITSLGTATLNGFTINVGHTAQNAAVNNTAITTGLNQVYANAAQTLVAGTNTFTFSTPFAWDGISNIVVSFNYSNNNSGGTSSAVATEAALAFTSSLSIFADAVSPTCLLDAPASGQPCMTTYNGNSTSSTRPYIVFTGNTSPAVQSISWSDGVSTIGTTSQLTVTPTSTTTYTATVTAAGCTVSPNPTVTVTVNPLPTDPIVTNSIQCGQGLPSASVVSTSGLTTPVFNWYDAATNGTLLQSSVSTTYTTMISATTIFYVSELNPLTGCESARVPVTVTVNTPPAITITGTSTICDGESTTLTVSSSNDPNYTYTWSGGLGTGAVVSASPSVNTTYSVVATDVSGGANDGCANTASFVVTVNPSPTAVNASSSSAVICNGGSVDLTSSASSNTFTTGTLTEGFETFPPSGWTMLNAGSGNDWSQSNSQANSGSSSMRYSYDTDFDANAWAISPQLNMLAGQTYTVSFWYKVQSSSYPEKLKVTVGNNPTVIAQSTTLWNNNGGTSLTNTNWAQGTITYTPSTSGNYYFGFNCYSDADNYDLFVDDISIQYSIPGAISTYEWTSSPVGFTSSAQNPANVSPTVNTTYTVTATNSFGCSNATSVSVVVNQPSSSSLSITSCDSYTWAQNGMTYNTSGTYTSVLPNALGCDSVITLNLTINQATSSIVSVTECTSYTWAQNGMTYFVSGMYNDTISNAVGCDSIITLDLTIIQPTTSSVDVTECVSYTWPQNGMTYFASGMYNDTINNAIGCDSIITLNLTINVPTSSTFTVTTCGPTYTWAQNGTVYNTTGTYTDTIPNALGCDSVITLDLTITPFVATATDNGDLTITATTGTTYQWIDCATNSPIAGATAQTFTVTANGSYAAIVSNGTCSDTTNCVTISNVGIKESAVATVEMFPNPTHNFVYITMSETKASVEVFDVQGKLLQTAIIKSGDAIDLSSYERGVYSIRVKTELGTAVERVVKN